MELSRQEQVSREVQLIPEDQLAVVYLDFGQILFPRPPDSVVEL